MLTKLTPPAKLRPMCEKTSDVNNEIRVLEITAPMTERLKCPISYYVDYALVEQGNIVCWVEIKCRGKLYPDPFVSLKKAINGVELSEKTNRPFVLMYSFPQGIYRKPITRKDLQGKIMPGGRTDRGDDQDREPMLVFNISDFKKFDTTTRSWI